MSSSKYRQLHFQAIPESLENLRLVCRASPPQEIAVHSLILNTSIRIVTALLRIINRIRGSTLLSQCASDLCIRALLLLNSITGLLLLRLLSVL